MDNPVQVHVNSYWIREEITSLETKTFKMSKSKSKGMVLLKLHIFILLRRIGKFSMTALNVLPI